MTDLFKKFLPLNPTMNYKKTLTGLTYLLKNNCKTSSSLDEMAKSALLEEIERILPFADESLPSYDLFEKVKDLLLTCSN